MTVRWRLTLILLLTMLPAAIYSLHEAWSARESEIGRIEASAHRLALVAAAYQREMLDSTRRVLTTLTQLPEIRSSASPRCAETLSRLLVSFPEYRDLATVDRDGNILCSGSATVERETVGDRTWFHQMRQTLKFTIGEYVVGAHGTTILPVAVPVVENGSFTGAVAASISIDWLQRLMGRINLPQFGVVHLLDRDGVVLAAYPPMADAARSLPMSRALEKVLNGNSIPPVLATSDRSGMQRLYGIASIEDGDAVVLFSIPHQRALSGVAAQFWGLLAGPLAMWALAVIAAWITSEFLIARWLRRLCRSAAAFSRGDLAVRPHIPDSPREIRQLAATFSRMADTIQAREAELRGSLKEKEILLKEIHHRVNNNLQTVTSLLNLQSRRVADPAARRVLDTTQMRVRALSLVHKHLYEGENLAAVDMKAFVAELCAQLWRLYAVDENRIRPVIDMPTLHVTPDTAIPLGLLITEAVANTLKHAFPEGRSGGVEITLTQDRSGAILQIADNGVGHLHRGGTQDEEEGLGLTLIRALALQLHARLVLEGSRGTTVVLQFNRPLDLETPAGRPAVSGEDGSA